MPIETQDLGGLLLHNPFIDMEGLVAVWNNHCQFDPGKEPCTIEEVRVGIAELWAQGFIETRVAFVVTDEGTHYLQEYL